MFPKFVKPKFKRDIPIWYRNVALENTDILESYALIELRVYKNSNDRNNEFLIGEFRSGTDIVFVATLRVVPPPSKHRNTAAAGENVDSTNVTQAPHLQTSSGLPSTKQILKPGVAATIAASLARPKTPKDLFWLIPDKATFEEAFTAVSKSAAGSRVFFSASGSVKFDTHARLGLAYASANAPSMTPHPNLMDFSIAAFAAHGTYFYQSDEGFLYTRGIALILAKSFKPSEPADIEDSSLPNRAELLTEYNRLSTVKCHIVPSAERILNISINVTR